MEANHTFMREALLEAENALRCNEIPVGCCIVHSESSKIIARGYNKTNESRNGTKHAEIVAIDSLLLEQGLDSTIFPKCVLFVSCEPCIMCAAALASIGIAKVVFGCHNDRFGGNGSILSLHSDNKMEGASPYEVEAGVMNEEAIALFQRFYTTENRRAPESKRKRKLKNED